MVLTTLGRTAARVGAMGRVVARPTTVVKAPMAMVPTTKRFFADYDYNEGFPGSRIRNPDPQNNNDLYPGMGNGWWALIFLSTTTFFWGQWYDASRGINIAIGLFGPNMPL